jgi:4-carboxymuconolactone decarboxylase
MKMPISRYPVPELKDVPEDLRNRMLAVQEKAGFIPNVFLVLAHRPDEFRAFFAYHDALMEKESGLTKAEREMIVVATSSANQCQYCVVAHGAILRVRAKNPLIADQVAANYRKADITPRQKAMLDFAMKVSQLQRRRCLGHRRRGRLLRHVEPPGELHRDAPERRVLRPGKVRSRA